MRCIDIEEAKTNLAKYIAMLQERLENEVVITRNGKAIAKLLCPKENQRRMRLGAGLLLSKTKSFTLKDEADKLDRSFGYRP